MRLNDLALGTLCLLLGIAVIAYAATFPSVPGQEYGPGLYPTLIGASMAMAGSAMVVTGVRRRDPAPLATLLEWQRSKTAVINALLLIVSTLFYLFAVRPLGFILTAFILLAVLLARFHGKWLVALLVAAIAAPALHYIFADLLLVPLPWGILQPLAW